MREILEQLSTEIVNIANKVEGKTILVSRFPETIIPDVFVKAVDVARGFKTVAVSQPNHSAPERVEGISSAIYSLADLRWKNYLSADEIRAWEKVSGGIQQAIAGKVARGVAELERTRDILLAQALTGTISYPQYPSGTFSVSFGAVETATWDATDILGTIESGIDKLSKNGFGGKYYLFAGRTRFDEIISNSDIQTLIQGQAIAVGVLSGETNLNIRGVEVVYAGYTVVLPNDTTTPLIPPTKAYLVAVDSVVNVFGIPNLINAIPSRYQVALAYNEKDLQGVEIVVATRYLPLAFVKGIVEFS
ncbi:MAG: major capsid protein [candidate division WOR-3 bacterium]